MRFYAKLGAMARGNLAFAGFWATFGHVALTVSSARRLRARPLMFRPLEVHSAGQALGAKGLRGGLRYEYSASDGGEMEERHVVLKVGFSF
jgi:hypothetical protein